jgi:hypothetical protein
LNYLRKLIESRDDQNETVVGVADGSVNVVCWDEKSWLAQKKMGQVASKVLFLGPIKDNDKLIPLLDIKYDCYGISYGWSGKQAVILGNADKFKDEALYAEFTKEFDLLKVPSQYREDYAKPEESGTKFFQVLKRGGQHIGQAFHKTADALSVKTGVHEVHDYGAKVQEQLLLGIHEFYLHHLDEFLKS